MDEFTIFKKEYYDLFTDYGYGVTTLVHIAHGLGYDLNTMYSEKARTESLKAIEQLLENDIVNVTFLNNEIYSKRDLTDSDKKEIIEKVKDTWKHEKPNFELLINFEYQKWYLSKIKDEQINMETDWKWFSEFFVPNMKNWIVKNNPKN